MDREIMFGDRHKVLRQAHDLYIMLCDYIYKKEYSAVVYSKGEPTIDSPSTQYHFNGTINVRVEISISDTEIALLDTRCPSIMGGWVANEPQQLAVINHRTIFPSGEMVQNPLGKYYLRSLDREWLSMLISGIHSVIPVKTLNSIQRLESPVSIVIFEECMNMVTNEYGEKYPTYKISEDPIIITHGDEVRCLDSSIKIIKPDGRIISIGIEKQIKGISEKG